MSDRSSKGPRVAIIGGCQIGGLYATATRLLPKAEVKAWHVGVHPADTDEEILALLPGFDLVISQISDWEGHISLGISRLREQGLPVVYLPTLVFTGFHPDTTYLPGSLDYHSIIVASAFALELPESRVPALFNAYLFAELGYFDVFDAAKAALLENFRREGYELGPSFDLWIRHTGQFMYTINHPHITVIATLCRLALARSGYIVPDTPLPEDINDYLATHFTWPIYPALAKRIGVPGSTTFLRSANHLEQGQSRAMPLEHYVSDSYRRYSGIDKNTLRVGPVTKACERLSALVIN